MEASKPGPRLTAGGPRPRPLLPPSVPGLSISQVPAAAPKVQCSPRRTLRRTEVHVCTHTHAHHTRTHTHTHTPHALTHTTHTHTTHRHTPPTPHSHIHHTHTTHRHTPHTHRDTHAHTHSHAHSHHPQTHTLTHTPCTQIHTDTHHIPHTRALDKCRVQAPGHGLRDALLRRRPITCESGRWAEQRTRRPALRPFADAGPPAQRHLEGTVRPLPGHASSVRALILRSLGAWRTPPP